MKKTGAKPANNRNAASAAVPPAKRTGPARAAGGIEYD